MSRCSVKAAGILTDGLRHTIDASAPCVAQAREPGSGAADGRFAYLYQLHDQFDQLDLDLGVIFGEIAKFVACAFAPAILVTPLGALSVIISAVLASFMLDEHLALYGKLGCVLSIVGSTVIVLNAPAEREFESVEEIVMQMETNLPFQLYASFVLVAVLVLMYHYVPIMGKTNVLVYVSICSLVGSISVIGIKGLAVGLKLTFNGNNQLWTGSFWSFGVLVAVSIFTQMNYLNKALDTFNTAVVSPIYYVMFTTATITASAILFNGWGSPVEADPLSFDPEFEADGKAECEGKEYSSFDFVTVLCGFATIVVGVFLLHASRGAEEGGEAKRRAPSSEHELLAL